jgi:hypothetical protein
MPIFRIFLVLLALGSPALAQDGARDAAMARAAAQNFRVYIDGVAQDAKRPDLTRPEIAALLGRIYDLDALNALPAAQGNDLPWLLDWVEAAKDTSKSILLFGIKKGSPDFEAIGRNMIEHQDQYAAATSFMIRLLAREAVSSKLFMASLAPEQRTRVREQGMAGIRNTTAEFIRDAISTVILSGVKPDHARLVFGALRDTRDVWADFFVPQDRISPPSQLRFKRRTDLTSCNASGDAGETDAFRKTKTPSRREMPRALHSRPRDPVRRCRSRRRCRRSSRPRQ